MQGREGYVMHMDALAVVKNYLNSSNEELALVINGPWGSGKTYFIKHLPDEVKGDKKIIYLSLFGVSSLKELDEKINSQILCSVLPSENECFKKKAASIGNSILELAKLGGPIGETVGSIVKDSVGGVSDLIKNDRFVFCFDDLERASISSKLVLGYINTFVEDGNKTIILVNESKLVSKDVAKHYNEIIDAEARPYYKIFKEKVVAHSLEFRINLDKDLFKIIDNWKFASNDVIKIIKDNIAYLTDLLNRLRCNNLRTIRFAMNAFSDLYNEINNEEKFKNYDQEAKNVFWREMLMQCMCIAIYIKENNKEVCTWKPGEVEKNILYTVAEEGKDAANLSGQNLWTMKAVYDYMTKYYYDADELNAATEIVIARIAFKLNSSSDPFNLILEWKNSSQANVISWLEKLKENLKNNKYKIVDYGQIIERVTEPSKLLGMEKYIGEICSSMEKNIKVYESIDDTCVIYAPIFKNSKIEEEIRKLSEIVVTKRQAIMKKQLDEILEENFSLNTLKKFYQENLGRFLREHTFLEFLNIDRLAAAVCYNSKKEIMWDFGSFLNNIYDLSNIKETYPTDDKQLKKLRSSIEKIKEQMAELDKIDELRYEGLLSCIDEALRNYQQDEN